MIRPVTLFRMSLAVLAGTLAGGNFTASAADKVWSGAAGDKLWSNNGNWLPSKPTSADDVIFGDLDATGTTGPSGASNNIVDAAFTSTIKSLRVTNGSGAHNTRLTNNLVISGSGGTPMFIGSGILGPNFNQTVVGTFQGPGTLAMTNTTGIVVVTEGTNTAGTAGSYKATLNLVGLDNFAANVSAINLAINADSNTSTTNNRPCGDILLAKTNVIVATTITVSESFNNGGALSSFRLGQSSSINVDTLRIGSRKGNGTLNFNTGWSSPTAKFRNKAGTGRGSWYIGEDLGSASGTGATGSIDLSGGTVDAQLATLYVGKGQTVNATGDGTGTLTFNSGTIDANAVEIGYQSFGGGSVGRGTVNVNGTALLKVNNNLRMGFVTTGNTDTTTGTLNVNGGTVTVAGDIVDGGADVSTTTLTVTNNGLVDLKPSGDTVAGNITVDVLNIGVASVTNYNTLTTTNITVRAPATAFKMYDGSTLSVAAVGTPGTLVVNGSLTLTNTIVKIDLGSSSDTVSGSGVLAIEGTNSIAVNPISGFGGGSYPVATFAGGILGDITNGLAVSGAIASSRYTFSFDTNTADTLTLNVGGAGPSSLTWSGDGSGNVWDLAQVPNWNNGGGPNTSTFYSLDNVTFDDSGSAIPAINLVGSLVPGSVNFNASKSYTFAGAGKITGPGTLVHGGSGTLTILTTNDYSGGTVIYGEGKIQVGDGSTANGGLGTGEIQDSGLIILNPATAQTISALISQGGGVNKIGPGTSTLSGANTFYGPLTVSQGILKAGSTTALGDVGTVMTVTNTGSLDVNGFNLGNKPVIVAGAGAGGVGAIMNSGASQGNALNNVTMIGDTTFGGPNRWDLSGLNSSSAEPGLAGNGFKLTKAGTNQVSITCYNSLSPWNTGLGDIDVLSGILSIQCYVTLGDNTKPMIIRSNAAVEFCHNGPTLLDKPIYMTNGCIQARYFGSTYPNYTDLSGPITLSGSNVFDVFATTLSLQVDGEIGGSGSLTKGIGGHTEGGNTSTGVGTLVLNASNSFTGDLVLKTGSVVLTNSGSVTKAANIVLSGGTLDASKRTDGTLLLASGQTLKGAGTLIGTVVAPASTTVAPGAAVGTINVTGSITLRGDTYMDIAKTNTTRSADKIAATGTVDLGGALTVTFLGNTNLAAGDTFTLFTGTLANSFTSVNLPVIPGVVWTNKTAIDGTIQVVSAEPSTPPTLTNYVSGGSLMLSWSTAYTGYVLQGQTNAALVGLTTNWADVAGVSNNAIAIPISPANGSTFFRLKK